MWLKINVVDRIFSRVLNFLGICWLISNGCIWTIDEAAGLIDAPHGCEWASNREKKGSRSHVNHIKEARDLVRLTLWAEKRCRFANIPVSAMLTGTACVMFCWPCIIVYQYSETNVMHLLFNLLRIKGLYIFRALVAHPQEALGILRACYVSWLHQHWCATPTQLINWIKNCIALVSLYPIVFSDFNHTLSSWIFSKNTLIQHLMKILPMGRTDRHSDTYDEANSRL
jgi:hypothetical protein